jgi:hypothetical protein
MAGSLARRLAPSALSLLALATAALTVADAHAGTSVPALTPVSAQDSPVASCSSVSANLARWTPEAGPPARFVADAFASAGSGLWVGLGYTDAGFWSAEASAPNDACDTCDELNVVVTAFDGKRRSFPVITTADQQRLAMSPPGTLKTLALTRLWHLAGKDWPVARLQQDYRLRYAPNRNTDGLSDPYPGWMAETSMPGKGLLRFALRVDEQVMCWCEFGWHGWSLAAPKKP